MEKRPRFLRNQVLGSVVLLLVTAAATAVVVAYLFPPLGSLSSPLTRTAATPAGTFSSSYLYQQDEGVNGRSTFRTVDDERSVNFLRAPRRGGSYNSNSTGIDVERVLQDNKTNHSDLLNFTSQEGECNATCCQSILVDNGNSALNAIPLSVQIIFIIILILMSAMFSGLTLGLMSLDKTGLEIVMDGGDEENAAYARRIYPIRKNGNLLLCTLLLGNVAVNALLSILLADKTGGVVGLLSSTFLIVIFGEIIPQALCSRYALRIGSACVPLVRVIIIIFWPIAKPLAFMLDLVLGAEIATTYSNSEMMKMLQVHVQEKVIDKDTAMAMTGALKYKDTTVKEVMTFLESTFMLSVDEKLSFDTIATIFKTGYSRIPVYEISKNNVIGLLFVKDLIFIDPEDETRVADFVEIFGRGVHVVWPDDKLGDVLRELKQGRSHMALVRDVNNEDESVDPYYEIKGIITLEDIIEEILGEEIVDETDTFRDNMHSVKVNRSEQFKWARLRLLDSKIVDETLSLDEVKAVAAHLSKNYPEMWQLITEKQLHRLISETNVILLPAAVQEFGQDLPEDLLYEKGAPSDTCTLILAGKVTVLAGSENFRSDVSSWCLMGGGALADPYYKADFSAFVSSGPCRCLRFTRARFSAAVDASSLEKRSKGSRVDVVSNAFSGTKNEELDVARNNDLIDVVRNAFSPTKNEELAPSATVPPDVDKSNNPSALPTAPNDIDKRTKSKMLALRMRRKPKKVHDLIEDNADQKKPSRVSFATGGLDSDGQLNAILSDGGVYQPKADSKTTTKKDSTESSDKVSVQDEGGIEYIATKVAQDGKLPHAAGKDED